jgi:hypothetical protein
VTLSFGFIAAYAVLIAIASVIEVPISRGFASVQLNLLIRLGSLGVAVLVVLGQYRRRAHEPTIDDLASRRTV